MKEQKLLVTMEDIRRFKVLKDIIEKKLKGVEAAEALGLHPAHISRLKKRLSEGGFEAILRKPRQEPPNHKISESITKNILKLRKDIYYDFNILHFTEKLNEVHKTSMVE